MTTPIPTEAQDALDLEGLRARLRRLSRFDRANIVNWPDGRSDDRVIGFRIQDQPGDLLMEPVSILRELRGLVFAEVPALLDTIAEQRAEIERLKKERDQTEAYAGETAESAQEEADIAHKATAALRAATERIAALEAEVVVSWTTVKDIMKAVSAYAASLQPGKPA